MHMRVKSSAISELTMDYAPEVREALTATQALVHAWCRVRSQPYYNPAIRDEILRLMSRAKSAAEAVDESVNKLRHELPCENDWKARRNIVHQYALYTHSWRDEREVLAQMLDEEYLDKMSRNAIKNLKRLEARHHPGHLPFANEAPISTALSRVRIPGRIGSQRSAKRAAAMNIEIMTPILILLMNCYRKAARSRFELSYAYATSAVK